ncbi:hypothetical protein A2997_00925 [Candidatus Nomurabacteria bacterium RIFCSPLOWO2_01_FULL_36_10b]|uniref:Calx-beta domain-containing protein n=1 Tax=Candidatus Nomurabacteria bacterium RIFCSPLOWO2_01_FULL_36_10b TaxID=1801766 RepID=A0A1F6WPT3_9BACT|nr:MAG: hypothetical protein A2997_00925 [Candidatus Nomurabacteria bacterium RIFCSPLOWO2_01_FULL_36_10b]
MLNLAIYKYRHLIRYVTFVVMCCFFLLIFSLKAYATDVISTPDSTVGDIGYYISMQLDSSGYPVISYHDLTNGELKILHCGDATCSSSNTITSPDTLSVGFTTSLQLDSSGNPVISYLDYTNANLKILLCGDSTCSIIDTITSPDTIGNVGQSSSLQLDSGGNPVVSYYDTTNGNLKILHCDSVDCLGVNSINSPDTTGFVGAFTSMQLDSSGFPIVSYFDSTNGNLKILNCGDDDCSIVSSTESPDTTGSVGWYPSLQLDSDGFPIVSYYDNTNGNLKVLHCGNVSCSIVSSVVSPDTIGNVGWYPSLQLDSDGFPVISYYDATNGDLKVLHCGDEDCSSGNTITSPDTTGDVGLYTSLQLGSNGNPVIGYRDITNGDLKVLHCDDPNCSGLTIEFDSATYSENENVAILNLTFEVSGEDTTTTGPNTVDIDITGGTASGLGVDYTYTDPTTLTILAGDYTTPQTITSTITIINDSDIENSETILLELTNADVDTTIGSQSTSTVTIIDDDSSSPVIATSNSSGGNVLRRLFLPKHTSLSSNSQQSFCPYFTNFLVRGNRDGGDNITDVSKLQTFLNERGYKAGYTDGSFGVNTEKALKSWQGAFANDVLSVWRAFLQPTGYFYQSSRHVANKQVGCTNITTVLDNGVVLQ